jgi:hypothetical protein
MALRHGGPSQKFRKNGHGTICFSTKRKLRLIEQIRLPVLVAAFGVSCEAFAWITTPFILERANPSKDGDAKLWAFIFWDGFIRKGKVARLPKG